jgi:hypothetical protein
MSELRRLRDKDWRAAGLVSAILFFAWSGISERNSARAAEGDRFRRLAPGVMTTIPANLQPFETASVHDLIEIRSIRGLQWQPHFASPGETLFEKAGGTRFERAIWSLEFSFKPLRMIRVDVPQPSGRLQEKLLWYLVYRVTNTGRRLVPSAAGDGSSQIESSDEPIRFQPHFVLESHEFGKAYLDRVIPAAVAPIQQREDPARPLLTSVEMARTPIPPSSDRIDRSVWGVAIWEDVDPRTDFFSVFVQGLSNAYRWSDAAEGFQTGDPPGKGRTFAYKTLQLNFWRPGDQYLQHEDEIRFGTPEGKAEIYGVEDGLDYAWVYR